MNRATPNVDAAEGRLRSPGDVWRSAWRRVSQGEIGSLPVILGLVIIGIIFQLANQNFLTPGNLTNLLSQIVSVGTLSLGVTMVLLLGEIDLSVGAVSGFTAAIMAVLSVKQGVPGPVAVLAALLTGLLIGLFNGYWFAHMHVPSFVVTLAGYLAFQGALLYVLGSTGTVNLTDPFIIALANFRLPVALGWALGIVFVLGYALMEIAERRQRVAAGLPAQSVAGLLAKVGLIALAVFAAVGLMSVNRNPVKGGIPIEGVPLGVFILIVLIVVLDMVTKRSPFGRHLFAVGGNAEAARRSGINVNGIRIAAFAMCSTLAACGGVLAGSRLLAVNQSSGSGDVLLNAIAAAVIGGTSLFGGRGSAWSALLGALVIGSIANGMDLLAFSSSVKFMVTGVVLLLAVTIDAYARSRRQETGR